MTWFGMPIFFTGSVFGHTFFSTKDDLEWFWQTALCKSIQLMLVLFMEKSCSFLEIFFFKILNHSNDLENCDAMISISTWENAYFSRYLSNHTTFIYKTWPVKRYCHPKHSVEIFSIIWRTGSQIQDLFHLPTYYN